MECAARLYLYFARDSSTVGLAERRVYLSYQPFVMFGDDWGKRLAPEKYFKKDAYRILLLGGSTAENFPGKILEKAFRKRFPNRNFTVVNAAYGGYNARQALILTAIWAPDLEPDMIISLDGANDLIHRIRMEDAGSFYLHSVYKQALTRPFLSPVVHLLRCSQLMHGITRLKGRMFIDSVDSYTDAIPVYISAQHSINLLAKGMGAERVIVLQPFMAFKDPMSEAEQNFTHYKYRESTMMQLYDLLDKELEILAEDDDLLYIDGRRALDGLEETIFSDDVHFVSERGYSILAEHITSLVTPEMVR